MLVHLGAGCLNQTPLDWDGNAERVLQILTEAEERRIDVLCLPELCLTGYGCEDAFHAPQTSRLAWSVLQNLLPACRHLLVNFGLPVWYKGAIYNVSAIVANSRLLGLVAKQHLAGDGIHYEPRWFKPWPAGVCVDFASPLGDIPLGDLLFELETPDEISPLRLGLEICEDAWVAERPGGRAAREGVDVILNPSASHFAFGKQRIRERFVIEGSRAFQCAYVYSNLVGNEAGRAIYDGGAMLASQGQILARGPRLFLQRHALSSALVDLTPNRVYRSRTSSFRPQLEGKRTGIVSVSWDGPKKNPSRLPSTLPPSWESDPSAKEEEFTRAVTLGLADYMAKSRSRGFVVSLSGGADSAACAVLISLMAVRLRQELETSELIQLFSYWGGLPDTLSEILTTVYQATENSGSTTRTAAGSLAKAIGSRHLDWDIQPLVTSYHALVEEALGRPLEWNTDDLAMQNIQARVRAPGPWMLANILGALFLSTSNRSEAAVGYATMDGDTSGGLAPLAGIDKDFLRRWLIWMENSGPEGYESLPVLSAVNVQPPTAELRPPEGGQTDEEDLMPYPVLERIERLAIRDRLSPTTIRDRLSEEFPSSTLGQRNAWIERFFVMFARNQWKRERYAPSFHLDDENLDPKTWCRFPILSGGFNRELEEMRASPEMRATTSED